MRKVRKIIAGLGNPGKEYENSRHNLGFRLLDRLADGQRFSFDKRFEAEVLEISNLVLVKPQTFMNESGRAIRKVVGFYKASVEDLVLVHDDLDIKLGEYKLQVGIGPKVHNGVLSVESCLNSKQFLRLRLGVDNRDNFSWAGSGADYVLGNFRKEEEEPVEDMIDESADELLITLGLDME